MPALLKNIAMFLFDFAALSLKEPLGVLPQPQPARYRALKEIVLSAWSRILSLRDLGEKQRSPLGLVRGLFCLREVTLEVLSQDDGSSASQNFCAC